MGTTTIFSSDSSGASEHGTHIKAALLGDSITARVMASGVYNTATAESIWNWANWYIGAPFEYTCRLGISGDMTRAIMTRTSFIPDDVKVVMLMTGTNDVISMSSAANQATIDSTFTSVSTHISNGINRLIAAGKIVVIGTILPNNGISTPTDSKIQLLDRLNTFITSLASNSVFVFDSFSAIWDSTQPTIRVAVTNMMNDGTHPSNEGSRRIGKSAMVAMKSAVTLSSKNIDIYKDFTPFRIMYSSFRSGTLGQAALKTNGTGNLADGWRSINNAGTPTWTFDNTENYVIPPDFVIAKQPVGSEEFFQSATIVSSTDGDIVRFMMNGATPTTLTGFPDGIYGGSRYFLECDVVVVNPVNILDVGVSLLASFTSGTSPVDTPFLGTTQLSCAVAGGNFASAVRAASEGYSIRVRTPILRVPENVASIAGLQCYLDAKLGANAAGTVKFGRVRMYHQAF
jgi:lysophospholipase L1-like esterase